MQSDSLMMSVVLILLLVFPVVGVGNDDVDGVGGADTTVGFASRWCW